MGTVRTELIKRIARELLENYPQELTTDFERNKKLVESRTNVSSARLRNRIAGYTTRLMITAQGVQVSESESKNDVLE